MAFYTPQLANMESHPFQPVQWRVALNETVEAAKYFARTGAVEEGFMPILGTRRIENAFMGAGVYKNVKVSGCAVFKWVWNTSGGALSQGQLVARRGNVTVTDLDSGGTNYATKAANFVDTEEFAGIVHVHDDAGGAGAVPENEFAQIYKNDVNTLYFQPDITTALAANDDLTIVHPFQIRSGFAGLVPGENPAIVVSPDGIPDNYMGWVVEKADAVLAKIVATGTAVTVEKGLISATGGLLTNGSSSALSLILAFAMFGSQTTNDTRNLMVKFDGTGHLGASA